MILTDGMFADHNFYTSPYSGKITKFFENPLLSWVGRGIRRVKVLTFTAKTRHKKNFKVCNLDHLIKSRL